MSVHLRWWEERQATTDAAGMGFQFCRKSHCLATTLDKSGAYLCREPALLHHQHKTVWGELGIQFQEEEAGTSICLWGGSHTHEPQGSIAITPLESKRFKVCSTLSFAWMFCFLCKHNHFSKYSERNKNTSCHFVSLRWWLTTES